MNRVIRPAKRVRGVVRVPGDKSISHRALILGTLASGTTAIRGLAPGLDVQSTRRCLEALGGIFGMATSVEDDQGRGGGEPVTVVEGVGFDGLKAPPGPLDCGNSGTTIRLLTGVLAACDLEVTLTGDASLRRRPMDRVAEPLRRMGARIEGLEAKEPLRAPFVVRGSPRLKAIEVDLPVASAQVKSAVLLAALRARGRAIVREPARSRDHTERMLRVFGVDVLEDGLSAWLDGPADLDGANVDVPADISSAAFFIAAAAALPGSRLLLHDVGLNPGRAGMLDVLAAMGAPVRPGEEREVGFEPVADLFVEGSLPGKLRATSIAGPLIPRAIDELVVLAVLAARADGPTEIRDARELRVKESDRIAMVAENLGRMGARTEVLPDGLKVFGPANLRGAAIDTAGDHRIAMAFAVAGLLASDGETTIHDAECADVSYPGFYEELERVCER